MADILAHASSLTFGLPACRVFQLETVALIECNSAFTVAGAAPVCNRIPILTKLR